VTNRQAERAAGIVLMAVGVLMGGGGVWHYARDSREADSTPGSPSPGDAGFATPFIWPGKNRPPAVPATRAALADDEPVIGIRVGNLYRAYVTRAFAGTTNHIVNDLIGKTPVSVTHCDLTMCTRVFTGDGSDPLPIMSGGYVDGLLLRIADRFYHQRDESPLDKSPGRPFPYRTFEFHETTWKVWRDAHSDTDVYVGGQSKSAVPFIQNK
jgi:Protein of unknown function (DUF3179)